MQWTQVLVGSNPTPGISSLLWKVEDVYFVAGFLVRKLWCWTSLQKQCGCLQLNVRKTPLQSHNNCCVSLQGLHPSEATSEGQLCDKTVRKLSPFKGYYKCGLPFPLFGGCTVTILRGLTYPKILCAPKKEERQRENGDITWLRSSL